MEHYAMTAREALDFFKSGEKGLTSEEAKHRLERNGRNALKEQKKHSLAGLFF